MTDGGIDKNGIEPLHAIKAENLALRLSEAAGQFGEPMSFGVH